MSNANYANLARGGRGREERTVRAELIEEVESALNLWRLERSGLAGGNWPTAHENDVTPTTLTESEAP